MKKSTFMAISIILMLIIVGFSLYLLNNVCEYGTLFEPTVEKE